MLAGVITKKKKKEREEQIDALFPYVDLFELRFDLTEDIAEEEIVFIRKKYQKPLLFTVRRKEDGGSWDKGEKRRLSYIESLCALRADFLDLEYDLPDSFFCSIRKKYPSIFLIISAHLQNIPEDLDSFFSRMHKPFHAWYKIACYVKDSLQLMQLLLFSKGKKNLSVIPMGKVGQAGRVMASALGFPISYGASHKNEAIAGQMSAPQMQKIYHFRRHCASTKIFALLGDPVDPSVGDLFHNHFFYKQGIDALYVKILLKKEELRFFLDYAKKLPFEGFSITAPLKEEAAKYVDCTEEAINTIKREKDRFVGYNTDGKGALDALDYDVREKKIVILGAGGSAYAIAKEAKKRGGKVYIYNRTPQRAQNLCKRLKVNHIASVTDLSYDILINTTPWFCREWVKENKRIMDVVQKPKWTPWIKEAKRKRSHYIFGRQMFYKQALEQQKIWDFIEK